MWDAAPSYGDGDDTVNQQGPAAGPRLAGSPLLRGFSEAGRCDPWPCPDRGYPPPMCLIRVTDQPTSSPFMLCSLRGPAAGHSASTGVARDSRCPRLMAPTRSAHEPLEDD